MLLSFLVPYRNRDAKRVQRCLQSLQNQTNKNFEVIFIDYGSQVDIKPICQTFSIVSYFHYETQGLFWSRSHALNLAAKHATGQYFCMVDIDLIYDNKFVETIEKIANENTFFQYRAYLVPQTFKDYDSLEFNKNYPFPITAPQTSAGLMVIPQKIFKEIGGFDEYFCVWGVEDIDLKGRLIAAELNNQVLEIKDLVTFHQWHEPAYQHAIMPQGWLTVMEEYAKKYKKNKIRNNAKFEHFTAFKRLAPTFFQNRQTTLHFDFSYPYMHAFTLFEDKFQELQAGESIGVFQSFEAVKASKNSRLAGLMQTINALFVRFRISYRLTELKYFDTDLPNFFVVSDFLFYFIAENRSKIMDYYWQTDENNEIRAVIIKK